MVAMIDDKQVIYDIQRCICHVPDACKDCSRFGDGDVFKCMEGLLADALELLKEQEPVHVQKREFAHMWFWCCGSCGVAITEGDKFCRMCGKSVKWE